MKANKKTAITISSIIAALAAIFFLVPLKAYKEYREHQEQLKRQMIFANGPKFLQNAYLAFCISWWKDVFENFFTTEQIVAVSNPDDDDATPSPTDESAENKLQVVQQEPDEDQEVLEDPDAEDNASGPRIIRRK